MSEINYQALREVAERAIPVMERLLMLPADDDLLSEQELKDFGVDIDALNAFKFLAGPETVLALLDERERNQQYIKHRDQENEDIALTVGKLRVELEAAKKRIVELKAEPVSQTYKLNQISGNSPVTTDGWISCSEQMPVIGELNWRTSFPLLITCEIGVIPAYYGFVSVNGDRHYGFMESLKYGDDSGGHPQTNEYGLISNVTHWMPLPEPPEQDGE
ncbi:ead/Ea22-like family protein [Escherichia coli]|nr:ead/Ea22-like family protein [Escherichia coli]MCF7465693.1 ead/Ea22-like family protein [Escherichia coli]HBI8563197.1 ead/Ea22-like family protein [Escherichia coli]HBI8576041.1 ead/Ea22-like family protein [Escherichia coli]HBI8632129.1 ead/Ea22-like family protein [Escherichia coli]